MTFYFIVQLFAIFFCYADKTKGNCWCKEKICFKRKYGQIQMNATQISYNVENEENSATDKQVQTWKNTACPHTVYGAERTPTG